VISHGFSAQAGDLRSTFSSAVRRHSHHAAAQQRTQGNSPALNVLNADALSKPHAVDLACYKVNVAVNPVITETHFKTRHNDSVVGVPGYTLSRRDRVGQRGGGVALYVRWTLQPIVWTYLCDDRTYDVYWAHVGNTFVGALGHTPRPRRQRD